QYKNNFRPPVAERLVLTSQSQSIHHREIAIDLRQIDAQGIATQLRQVLDGWQPLPPVEAQPDSSRPETGIPRQGNAAVALAARPAEQLAIPAQIESPDRLYLEPFQLTRNSIIWSFNTLYWNALDKWEATFQKGYES